MTEAPLKKSSICNILEGSKLCRKRFVNISNIYSKVSPRVLQHYHSNVLVSSLL